MHTHIKTLSTICVALVLFNNCKQSKSINLQKAGQNKQELLKVTQHYEETGEKQKLEAAVFLLNNMSLHLAERYEIKNKNGEKQQYIPGNYTNYQAASLARDSIERTAEIRYFVDKDIQILDSAYLVENINLAFQAWEQNKKYSSQNFDDFLQYVVPYRVYFENLSNWRKKLNQHYQPIFHSAAN